ncbi:MAG: hypothetical protein V9G29_14665 [Burkholderiaceae bacterium]
MRRSRASKLSQRWVATQGADRDSKARRVYYLSMEFLIGRTLGNALAALDLTRQRGAGAGASCPLARGHRRIANPMRR